MVTPMRCPFCARENPEQALVCSSCARDIAIPPSLIAERDDLVRKRDEARDELARARAQVAIFRRERTRTISGRNEHEA